MSLYNMVFGKAPSHFLLPMLDLKEGDFSRYKDVFLQDADDLLANRNHRYIYVYTGKKTNKWNKHKSYLRCYNDTFYNHITYVFSVPAIWEKDYDILLQGIPNLVSHTYKSHASIIYGNSLSW